MKIDIIGAPIYQGNLIKGTEKTPDYLRANNLMPMIQAYDLVSNDLGNICQQRFCFNNRAMKKEMHCYYNIVKMAEELAQKVRYSKELKNLPFVIGGDHSVSIGSLAGISYHHQKTAIIWVDAHADFNTTKTSLTKNAHGMVLAMATGLGPARISQIYQRFFDPKNIYILGLRSVDVEEEHILKDLKVNTFSKDDLEANLGNVLETIILDLKYKEITEIHLSLDIDALDPMLVPGTGTPVPHGLSLEVFNNIVSFFISSKMVTSLDLVEYNPRLDDKKSTTKKTVMQILENIFKSLKEIK